MAVAHAHRCEVCGIETHDSPTLDRICCGEFMSILSAPGIESFKSFWHPNLSHEPVFIDSVKTLDKELSKRNLHVKEEKRGGRAVRLPQTKEEAANA